MPSDRVAFLSRDEVLAIHSTLLERFGGPAGVRDFGLLESALYRPRTGHYADLDYAQFFFMGQAGVAYHF